MDTFSRSHLAARCLLNLRRHPLIVTLYPCRYEEIEKISKEFMQIHQIHQNEHSIHGVNINRRVEAAWKIRRTSLFFCLSLFRLNSGAIDRNSLIDLQLRADSCLPGPSRCTAMMQH